MLLQMALFHSFLWLSSILYFLFLIININSVGGEGRKLTCQLTLSVSQVKIHRIVLDSSISFIFQIQSNSKCCQLYLQNIARNSPLPTTSTANNLVQDAIISYLNYCSSLLPWFFSASTIALFSLLSTQHPDSSCWNLSLRCHFKPFSGFHLTQVKS